MLAPGLPHFLQSPLALMRTSWVVGALTQRLYVPQRLCVLFPAVQGCLKEVEAAGGIANTLAIGVRQRRGMLSPHLRWEWVEGRDLIS